MTLMSLKVLRGVDLIARDRNWTTEDTSDPYCEIYVNGQNICRTPVLSPTLDPIWGGPMSTCVIESPPLIPESESDSAETEVTVKIYDFNEFLPDAPMGQVTFLASDVLVDNKKNARYGGGSSSAYPNVWLPVEPLDGCDCSGKLEVRMLKLSDDGNDDPAAARTVRRQAELRQSALTALCAGPKLGGTTDKTRLAKMIRSSRAPVTLHVYDVSNDSRVAAVNAVIKNAGGGIFHAAVEIYGREYSFGGSRHNTTGVFACKPRKCPMHRYRESIFLGDCDLEPSEVGAIVRKMKPEWMAPTYDLLRKNCVFFSKELAAELGVGSIPQWIYSLADVGAAIEDYMKERRKAQKEKKEREEAQKKLQEEEEEKKKNKYSVEPTWGLAPTGTDSTTSSFDADDSVEVDVDDLIDEIESSTLDNIMAARLQRMYRASHVTKGQLNTERLCASAKPSYGKRQDSTRASCFNVEVSLPAALRELPAQSPDADMDSTRASCFNVEVSLPAAIRGLPPAIPEKQCPDADIVTNSTKSLSGATRGSPIAIPEEQPPDAGVANRTKSSSGTALAEQEGVDKIGWFQIPQVKVPRDLGLGQVKEKLLA